MEGRTLNIETFRSSCWPVSLKRSGKRVSGILLIFRVSNGRPIGSLKKTGDAKKLLAKIEDILTERD